MKKIKVAHITKNLPANGIANVVLNYSENINKGLFDMTIITGNMVYSPNTERCKKKEITLIQLPSKRNNLIKYVFNLINIFKTEKYDIVHVHGNSTSIAIELFIAKMCGIKVRIAHCHSYQTDFPFFHKLLYPLFKHSYTKGYACSKMAGKWLFGKNEFTVLPNAFDTHKFLFDSKTRSEIRKKYNIEDKYVIGTIARFNESKNHKFLLEVFETICDDNENVILMLAGDGPYLPTIQNIINNHKYKDKIIYLGVEEHPENLYNAFDVFVLPSKFEGLGIVFIEAQINGLRCVTTVHVPPEVNINNHTTFLELSDDICKWKNAITSLQALNDRGKDALAAYESTKRYDIHIAVKKLEQDYLNEVNNNS